MVLEDKPKVIILKSYENGQQWAAYWSALGATKYMRFNTTNGEATSNARWYDTEPTTSVFTIGNDGEVNTNTEDQIAYCFAEKPGFSKFGTYTGNGADGSTTNNFIYTGFKPAWVMVKRSNDSGQQWTICDSVRSPTNVTDSMEWLFAESGGGRKLMKIYLIYYQMVLCQEQDTLTQIEVDLNIFIWHLQKIL